MKRPGLDRPAALDCLLAVHAQACSEAALTSLAGELQRQGEFNGVQIVLGDEVTGRRGRAGNRNALRTLAGLPPGAREPRESGAIRSWLIRDSDGEPTGELQCLLGPELAEPAADLVGLLEQSCQQLGIAFGNQHLERQAHNSQQSLVDEQAERRLSERAFDLMFDESPLGMATLSLAPEHPGLIVAVNESLRQLLGRGEAELLDHVFMVLIHPDDRAASNSSMRRAMAGRRTPIRSQPRLLDADGQAIPVQLIACPLFDDEDQARYALLQIQDLRTRGVVREPQPEDNALLGLPTGTELDRAVRQSIDRVRRLGTTGVAMICDVDQLVSPSGRASAEIVRQSVAGALRQSLRGEDLIGRVSQNRFLVIAEEVPTEHAETVARRITDALTERALAIQIGVAVVNAALTDERVLVKRATSAMFSARTAGLPYQLYTLNDSVLYSSTESGGQLHRQVLYAKPGWRQA